MRTQKQIEACRANGAKSRGPITAQGKAISSRNSLKHGFLSHLLIDGEDQEKLDAVFLRLAREHEPETDTDYDILENMAAAQWRQMRIQDIETECFDEEMRTQVRLSPQLGLKRVRQRAAKAWKTWADESNVIQLTCRYEARFERQYMRYVKYFEQRKKERAEDSPKKLRNEPETDLIALYSTLPSEDENRQQTLWDMQSPQATDVPLDGSPVLSALIGVHQRPNAFSESDPKPIDPLINSPQTS